MHRCQPPSRLRPTLLAATLVGLAACATGNAPAQSTASPVASASSPERIDAAMNARIRDEGMKRSRGLETAIMISDSHGPRLAGSSGYMTAANWARGQLAQWGISNARLESWGKRGKGWELERFSVEMLAPYYLRINAIPKAW